MATKGKMTLAEALASEAGSTRKGPKCAVRIAELELPEGDRSDFMTAIEDRSIPATEVARALGRIGVKLAHEKIARHRRRDCACDAK